MRMQPWMWGAGVTLFVGALSVGKLYTNVANAEDELKEHKQRTESTLQAQLIKDRQQWQEIRNIGKTLIRIDERTKQTSEDVKTIKEDMHNH